jgi:putative Mg2+ transporter-C (MgtC) family protein
MHTTEWELLWRLGLALVLSTVIGLEREYRQKSAGLRTYTLVGLGSALFLLANEFGFFDELERGRVVLDVRATGRGALTGLVGELGELDGVLVVHTAETDPD